MKKRLWFLALAGLCVGPALADLPAGYQMKSDSLLLVLQAPPALVYITDSQDHKTGADPSKALNPDGSQGIGLSEIPLSQVLQTAMTAPDTISTPGVSEPNQTPTPQITQTPVVTPSATPAAVSALSTGWTIKILDGGSQAYNVYLKGVTFGVASVTVSGSFSGTSAQVSKTFSLLVSPGNARQVQLNFDTDEKTINISRTLTAWDLSHEVELAGKLKLITSPSAVSYLRSQADTAQGGSRITPIAVRNALNLFLHALGESRPKRCADEDDSKAMDDSIREALKEDAQAILDALPPAVSVKL